MPRTSTRLTDDEGAFLALLIRVQPATAYQISKIYAESPVSNFGTSKGKIYPLVDRLAKRGLLKKRTVKGDARGSDWLECTASGRKAVRSWVLEIRQTHFLLDDPIRTKVQSFDLLSRDEQLEWIVTAKAGLQRKLDDLDDYSASVTVPFKAQVHDNAVSSVRSRMEWLDRLLASIVKPESATGP